MSRPSVFGPEPVALVPTKTEEAQAVPVVRKAREEPEMMRTSIYIARAVHDALREIAFHERVKVNELIVEGIDQVLAKRRQPTSAEIKRKAS